MLCFFSSLFLGGWFCNSFPTGEAASFNSSTIRDLIISSHQESLQIVNETLLHSRQRQSTLSSSTRVFAFRRQTEPETLEISRAAEVFQTTLRVLKNRAKQRYKRDVTEPELLSWEDVKLIAELSGCPPATHRAVCEHSHLSKYRTVTGVCNNRQNPLWGTANTALVRWLPAEYEDGVREPKGWNRERLHNGFQLPSPRTVSREIMSSTFKEKDEVYSQMLVGWGQFTDHDVAFTPQSTGTDSVWAHADCFNTCENLHPCYPIERGDMHYGGHGCMPFLRSKGGCFVNSDSDMTHALQRQQINSLTSFIDASTVYSNSPRVESSLRDLSGLNGKLAVNSQFKDPKGRPYMPFTTTQPSGCPPDRAECFNSGDGRANEVLYLTVLHTLWVREHNRLAEALKRINSHWSPETIYQEARKIVGALHQIITIRDYLPNIIGPESFARYIGPYRGYDPTVNPTASNVFVTAAFRFGHATVSPTVSRLNASYQEHEHFPHLRLQDSFFTPWRIVKEGGLEPILRGMIGTPASTSSSDKLMTEAVTESLVVVFTALKMDLASLNLQRGRDHGLPGYNKWREFCGLKRIKTLEDLREVVGNYRVAAKILNVYKHPDNIDVWLGGLIETKLPGSRAGPLFACLIGKQMKNIRDGDRFWWEADSVFTQQQRDELAKYSLSRLMCDNSDVDQVPLDSFRLVEHPSDFVSCDRVPSVNLEAWREEKSQDLQRCGSPGKTTNGDFILSSISGKLVALYSCYHGFKLEGAAAIVCEGNRWSDQPPQCTGNHQ